MFNFHTAADERTGGGKRVGSSSRCKEGQFCCYRRTLLPIESSAATTSPNKRSYEWRLVGRNKRENKKGEENRITVFFFVLISFFSVFLFS